MDVSRISKLINVSGRYFLFVLAGCTFVSSEVYSFELSADVYSGLEYTSNAESSTTNTQDDLIESIGFNFGIVERRKRVRADADINVSYTRYENETYSDELSLTSGFGLFSIDLVEDFLNWQATFTRTDVLQAATQDEDNPDNKEYRNIFRTGPTVYYAIGPTANLAFSANYIYLENSDQATADSERANGQVTLSHRINSITQTTLSLNHEEVLESDDEEKLSNSTASIGIERELFDGSMRFNVGAQRVDSNQQSSDSDESDSNFFDLNYARNSLLGHFLELSYSEELSDTAIGFESDESGQGEQQLPVGQASQTELQKRKRVTLLVGRDLSGFAYDLNLLYQESNFQTTDTSERFRSITIGVEQNLAARITPRFEYQYYSENFSTPLDGEDVSKLYRILLDYQVLPDVHIISHVEYEKIDNDENMSRESEEFRAGLRFQWDLL